MATTHTGAAERHFLIPKLGLADRPAANDNAAAETIRTAVHQIFAAGSRGDERIADLVAQTVDGRYFVLLTLTAAQFDALAAWDAANEDGELDDTDHCEAEEAPISAFEGMKLGVSEDDEASLGWSEERDQNCLWASAGTRDDREEEADGENSLGWTAGIDQERIFLGIGQDLEDEHDGRETEEDDDKEALAGRVPGGVLDANDPRGDELGRRVAP